MQLEQSPFPAGWWGTAMDKVGLGDQRPDVGTYGRYEYANLPPLPVPLDGELGWLADAPMRKDHIGEHQAEQNAEALPKLLEACRSLGLSLPPSFLKFARDPRLPARIRSNTDCFLYFAEQPFLSPVGAGSLVQFLADSQGCAFWYLYVPAGNADHAVVSSSDFYHPDARAAGYDEPDPGALVFCAESFEAFLCRFWLENELWFSAYDGTPVTEAGRQYLEHYLRSPADPLRNAHRPPGR